MSEVQDAQTGATVAPVQNTAPEQEQVQATATESTTEQIDSQSDGQPRDEKGRFTPIQHRINELTRHRRDAERERDFYRQQYEASQKAQPAPAPQSEKAPTLADYNFDADAWASAHEQYISKRMESITEQKLREKEEQRSAQQAKQQFETRSQAFAKDHADYGEALATLDATVQFQPQIVEAIAVSEHGPAVAYHLANHLDEADRIARLPPHLAAVQLGRIEALVSAPKPKPVTRAPDPAPTVGGGAALTPSLSGMSTADFIAARNRQEYGGKRS